MSVFQKILIANRGEIAVRIIKTANKLGIKTLAVYSKDDRTSLHVSMADEAVLLEGDDLFETYLNQEKLIQIAIEFGAAAIHPGYGFLSENAAFSEKVEKSGLIFIGATPNQIRLMGQKMEANRFVEKIGIPIIPQIAGTEKQIIEKAKNLEFPLLIKASAGGGGKGIEIVNAPDDLYEAIKSVKRKSLRYFADDKILAEKYIKNARHIEVQILGDGLGNVLHLFERECSIQRHHQKLIEEAPANSISTELKERLYQSALKIAQSIKYRGAGTIEFLVDKDENFYFLEMNTRLQVEHPVTEMITGIDLVEEQLNIAAGNKLSIKQKYIVANGNAIELRICSENPAQRFLPTTGLVHELYIPENTRWDSYLQSGVKISPLYDSLVGKLIVHGKNRSGSLTKLKMALSGLFIQGVQTNQEFLSSIIAHPDFSSNSVHTQWIEEKQKSILQFQKKANRKPPVTELLSAYLLNHFYSPINSDSPWKQKGYYRIFQSFQIYINNEKHLAEVTRNKNSFQLIVNGHNSFELTNCKFSKGKIEFILGNKDIIVFICKKEKTTLIQLSSKQYKLRSNHVLNQVLLNKTDESKNENKTDKIVAGLYGRVINILIKPGDKLKKGQDLIIIESMKSEITLKSPLKAIVKNVNVSKGEIVADNKTLVEFEA